jgi:TonB family protein
LFQAINIKAARNYPRRAINRRLEGIVPVRLWIGADGALRRVDVLDKSQAPSLIRAALKAVQKAAPFPAFNNDLGKDERRFDVRIIYKIP